jgi:hypothetical protein
MTRGRVPTRRSLAGLAAAGAAALLTVPATASAIPTQTFTDPVGGAPVAGQPLPDNCRFFATPGGDFCGPDITGVTFSTPGDGNLHVDIAYASLPVVFGIPQQVEHVDIGLYPKTATAVDLFWDRRIVKFSGGWVVSARTGQTTYGTGGATQRPLGIEIVVPLSAVGGDPAAWRYVVNAGIVGEVVPEHAELVPNAGFIDLTGDPTPQILRANIGPLAGIPAVQRGAALTGTLTLGGPADELLVEALVKPRLLQPSAATRAPLKRIALFRKRNVTAGPIAVRLPLTRSVRSKLKARPSAAITLRITLRDEGVAGVRTRQVIWTAPAR